MQYKRLWIALGIVLIISFAVLGGMCAKIISSAPPIPSEVLTTNGQVVFDGESIRRGQEVWESLGGREIGSIWGHGSYVAPDWSADWLHREATLVLNSWAEEPCGVPFAALPLEQQAGLRARLETMMRTNTYDAGSGRVTIDPARADAFESLSGYYANIFSEGRNEYAIPRGALTDQKKLRDMSAFFWWTSWVSTTNRPGDSVIYTNNWPHEPLVANNPTGNAIVWSIISFILLQAGIGGLVWYYSSQQREPVTGEVPANDPLLGFKPTPSQRALIKTSLWWPR